MSNLQSYEIAIPFCVINLIFKIIKKLDIDLPTTIKDNFSNTTEIKKLLIIHNLMEKSHIDTWVSKDEYIMSKFVDLLLCIYKYKEKTIVNIMFKIIEKLMNDGESGKISENNMKNDMDIVMKVKSLFNRLDNVNLNSKPYASWIIYNDKILLNLKYDL